MIRRLAVAALALVIPSVPTVPAVAGEPVAARAAVERLIAATGAEVSVAFRTLDGKDELLVRPDVPFHAASTMKVPVMIELFAQARKGKLGLDDPLA